MTGTRLGAARLVDKVGVRQLAALGPSGGSGRVDQGGRVARLDRGPAGVDLSAVGQVVDPLADLVAVRVGLRERQHKARVLQHPPHLLGRGRLVNRHVTPPTATIA